MSDVRLGPGTEAVSGGGGSAQLLPAVVEAVDGPGKGRRGVLSTGTMIVGSGSECGLVLADPTISRRHAQLELLEGRLRVKDLGSRNGTLYLGSRLSEAEVPLGATVRLGKTTLRFTALASAAPVSARERLGGLIGRSQSMREVFAVLERVAPSESTVLISGETGVGKDAVARQIHALSSRARAPFVVCDCAAINGNLVESALFGHVRGAFTGAVSAQSGLFEQANGGTLFLDEVGELPLDLQPKLLRVLEAREFRRVGEGGEPRKLDLRVLAATHRDLLHEVERGRFRADLYYRLAVTVVRVPPLRERLEDIPVLASELARSICGVEVSLSNSTLAALACDPWAGNVRELRNAVERIVALGSSASPGTVASGPEVSFLNARERLLDQFERDYLVSLLARHPGNMSAAARESKLSRSQFYRLLRKHELGASLGTGGDEG